MLYAVGCHPPNKLMDEVAPLMRKCDLRWQTLGTEPLKDRLLYLAIGYQSLIPHLRDLHGVRSAIVVFDAPIRLFDIEPDTWLDADKPDLSYRFPLGYLKIDLLHSMVRRLDMDKEPPCDLRPRRIDLMPRILKELVPTGFLEVYNAYILGTTGPGDRQQAHDAIGDVLFRGGTIIAMRKELQSLTPGETASDLIEEVIVALTTPDGRKVMKACDRLGRNWNLVPRKVAEQEGCDPSTIRYLFKAQTPPKEAIEDIEADRETE